MKTAIITGISGQDGLYLAEFLREKKYRIVGTSRDINAATRTMPRELVNDIELFEWDADSYPQLRRFIEKINPDEIYNFAALSSGEQMYKNSPAIGLVNGSVVSKILSAIQELNLKTRFCQASSSEIFGNAPHTPQTEVTPFNPRNPYGAAKLYGHHMIDIYRERYGLFACSAILYNHESPRRGLNFVTRKITHTAAQIKLGLTRQLVLGNLDIKRDWMFAGDAVNAMWMMLQSEEATDYIVASGTSRSVRNFCKVAFEYLDLNYEDFVVSSPEFSRPINSVNLEGDTQKLNKLGWSASMSFEELVHKMVDSDVALIKDFINKQSITKYP
jgi:GDPmannose 4,6-dehydratase